MPKFIIISKYNIDLSIKKFFKLIAYETVSNILYIQKFYYILFKNSIFIKFTFYINIFNFIEMYKNIKK